ncbi:hypothetical protein C7974DRAFT_428365 [Boeremia exigua]|uniref:uncharacterized protein n=1 Tax=Boeremia exigua TaxID=749465 RepID=UPI001E8DFD8F|nr:uncharacterized protein C7974DRAFT_428365 [Boeremia exigua]KAH6613897.1 hypothetical protein C7974DRAFT_428365 [Boeremia exigua]
MPPHMHPRSLTTASLFTSTLMLSFLVVAAPHLIPCPVDPRTLADGADPARRRRRRACGEEGSGSESENGRGTGSETGRGRETAEEQRRLEERMNPRRECPIPKPGGLVGQVLGLMGRGESSDGGDDKSGQISRQVGRIRGSRPGDDG